MIEIVIVLFILIILIILVIRRSKDNFMFPNNNMYWPQYYYSFPYNYENGGIWPPGMYNRLNFWSPGFYSGSGLSWGSRPGAVNELWPRNRWVNSPPSGKYYNITNNGDWVHDAANYRNNLFRQ